MALRRRSANRFQATIWPGFVDAMTGLLLVLMFVLTIFTVVQFVLRDTITGQESELDALGAEVDRLASALGLERDKSAGLEQQVGSLTDTLSAARDRVEGQAQRISDLEATRDDLLAEQEASRIALSQARDEVDAQAEAARLAAARRDALEALVADLKAGAEADAETIETLEAERLADAAAAQALRERLADADAELSVAELTLEEQRREAEETLTLLAAAKAAREDLDAQLLAALSLQDRTEEDLDAALAAQEGAEEELATVRSELEARLAQALADAAAAEDEAATQLSEAEQRAALLASAREALNAEEAISAEAQRKVAALNAQVSALRSEVGQLKSLLDLADAADAEAQVRIESLGNRLNTALARVAAEERRRRELEESERKRLEEEAARLAAEAENLERYRSNFFGELRGMLEGQEGVRVEGDRFVFSSEVLFDQGRATLSDAGEREISKVAALLRRIAAEIPPEIDWVIRVDGHTDDVPIRGGAFANNWELSQARALSVVLYMIEEEGISPTRLAANGFGENQPLDPSDTEEARAKNRRIELKLTER